MVESIVNILLDHGFVANVEPDLTINGYQRDSVRHVYSSRAWLMEPTSDGSVEAIVSIQTPLAYTSTCTFELPRWRMNNPRQAIAALCVLQDAILGIIFLMSPEGSPVVCVYSDGLSRLRFTVGTGQYGYTINYRESAHVLSPRTLIKAPEEVIARGDLDKFMRLQEKATSAMKVWR